MPILEEMPCEWLTKWWRLWPTSGACYKRALRLAVSSY